MKPIDRGEILGIADYETIRERFRGGVIAEKKRRRVALGPNASVVFENRDTVVLQVQEMLRTERITRAAAIQHEIDTYNELLPANDELSITLMIEIADTSERDAFLKAATGFEHHVWLVAGEVRIAARSSERDVPGSADRTTAVHYLKFALPKDVADALRARASGETTNAPPMALEVDHAAYKARSAIPLETVVALGKDLEA